MNIFEIWYEMNFLKKNLRVLMKFLKFLKTQLYF